MMNKHRKIIQNLHVKQRKWNKNQEQQWHSNCMITFMLYPALFAQVLLLLLLLLLLLQNSYKAHFETAQCTNKPKLASTAGKITLEKKKERSLDNFFTIKLS